MHPLLEQTPNHPVKYGITQGRQATINKFIQDQQGYIIFIILLSPKPQQIYSPRCCRARVIRYRVIIKQGQVLNKLLIMIQESDIDDFSLSTCFNNQSNPYSQMQDYYFDSYSHYSIHQQMLKDSVRTKSYMKSIINNPHLFKDKIVLDIGSGTGVLSIFAAKAGAKKVYAIENAGISNVSEEIIRKNGLDGVIKVVKGRVEEIELEVEKVDIIISEWMGYFLLYESMLDCVLFARDKWLRKGGKMFPNKATMYIAAIEDEEYYDKVSAYWNEVYGFTMKGLKRFAINTPAVDHISQDRVVSDSVKFKEFDLEKVTVEQLDFDAEFKLIIRRPTQLHGFLSWFTTDFSHGKDNICLNTSPFKKWTHWKQTVFYLQKPLLIEYEEEIQGKLRVGKGVTNKRNIEVDISITVKKAQYNQKYIVS